jgi:hypothetical protein
MFTGSNWLHVLYTFLGLCGGVGIIASGGGKVGETVLLEQGGLDGGEICRAFLIYWGNQLGQQIQAEFIKHIFTLALIKTFCFLLHVLILGASLHF